MATRVTRSGTKRNATETTTTQESPSSPQKQPKPQKRQKKEDAKPASTSKEDQPKTTSSTGEDQSRPTLPTEEDQPTTSSTLKIIELTGDIFTAPPNTIILHACNTDGSWNAGIAKAFKSHYPEAHTSHIDHCTQHGELLLDTAQLIPPVDYEHSLGDKPKHFVGCLFTSRHYGRRKDKPGRILEATGPAMGDLLRQVGEWNASAKAEDKVDEVRMCKINSGMFAVPWEKTKAVLEGVGVGESGVKVVKVISPP